MPVYLLHSTVPLQRENGQTVRHYLGYCDPGGLARRLEQHRKGEHSAKVLAAMREKGATFLLGAFWADRGRVEEKQMKRNGHLSGHCLVCRLRRLTQEYDDLLSRARVWPATPNGRSTGPGPNSLPPSGGGVAVKTVGWSRRAPRIRSTVYRVRRWRSRGIRRGTAASSATAPRGIGGSPPAGTRR